MPKWCAHFSARVQERILVIAIAIDARVDALENLFIHLMLEECPPPVTTSRPGPTIHGPFSDRCWEVVDSVDLRTVFDQRFPVLQSCPCHVRGNRQAERRVLEVRSHSVRTQDLHDEVHGWKLFWMLPVTFLHRGLGGKVTKEELRHRFDLFASGGPHCGSCNPRIQNPASSAQTDGKRAAARAAKFRWEK